MPAGPNGGNPPPLPPQFPRTYEVQWFEQPVDHFNLLQPSDLGGQRPTFKQRLLFHKCKQRLLFNQCKNCLLNKSLLDT